MPCTQRMKSNAALDMVSLEKALDNENNAVVSTMTTRKIGAENMRQLQQLGFSPATFADTFTN